MNKIRLLNFFIPLCCLFGLIGTAFPSYSQSHKSKLFLVGGDSKVHIVDYNLSKDTVPEVIWSWDAHEAKDLPEEFRNKKFNSIDDMKPIKKGKQILVSSSSGAVAIINQKDKKVLFYAAVPNAHSIEILPNNRLVAAASTAKDGNKIMLFDLDQPDQPLFTDSLYSAHGVVWNGERKSLFALGYAVLREYKMATKDSLYLINKWEIPGESGHDLFPSPDGKHLYMTEHTGAWTFNLENHLFEKIPGFPDAENIKSIGRNPWGQYIFTVPEESWWTYHVSFFEPDQKFVFPDIKVYKARWYTE